MAKKGVKIYDSAGALKLYKIIFLSLLISEVYFKENWGFVLIGLILVGNIKIIVLSYSPHFSWDVGLNAFIEKYDFLLCICAMYVFWKIKIYSWDCPLNFIWKTSMKPG